MKAIEFKRYKSISMYILLHDLDHDFEDLSPIKKYYTEEEEEQLWQKEVIYFGHSDSGISWGDNKGPWVLDLYVSNLTDKQRVERDKEYKIKKAIENLELLTNKKVKLKDIK